MRIGKILLAVVILFVGPWAEAQSVFTNSRFADPYLGGILHFKVKESHRSQTNESTISHDAFERFLTTHPEIQLKKRFPGKEKPTKSHTESGERFADLSLIYSLTFIPETDPLKYIDALRKTGISDFIEPHFLPNLTYVPNDDSVGVQYALQKIQAFAGWDVHRGDTNTVIGITDTGCDPLHPDISENIARNWSDPVNGVDDDNDGYVDNFIGWDTGNNDNDPTSDGNFHGQHVTGLSSAQADNELGIAGTGFDCRFIHVKIANSGGSLSGAYEGLVYAADHGCKIVNCSWGGLQFSEINAEIVRYAAINQNCLVTCGAGNNNNDLPFYPAAYEYAFSVGSTNALDFKADFSNFGYTIDLVAPGDYVLSTWAGNGYLVSGGTSMSSPIVAGCAGIVHSAFPTLNSRQIAERIKLFSDTVDQLPFNAPWETRLGEGRLNLFKSLTETGVPAPVMHDINITDSGYGQFLPGDTINIAGFITNYLYPANSVILRNFSLDNYLQPLQNDLPLGSLNTLQTFTASSGLLRFVIAENCPLNQQSVIRFEFESDGQLRNQYITVSLHADFVNVSWNDISTSIGSKSLSAVTGNGYLKGLGFQYNGNEDLLYECGLMVGQNDTYVADNVRSTAGTDSDFSTVERITQMPPYEGNAVQYSGKFESNIPALSVRVNQRVIADSSAQNRKFVILEYNIINTGIEPYNGMVAGIFADWDLINAGQNSCGYDQTSRVGYVNTLPDTLLGGVQLLNFGSANFYAVDNVPGGNGGINLYDGFSSAEKNQIMRNVRLTTGAGNNGTDAIMVLSTPAFDLAVADTQTVAFALLAGNSVNEIVSTGESAEAYYFNEGIPLSAKDILSKQPIVYPNPANDEIFIKGLESKEKVFYRLINSSGMEMSSGYITSANSISTKDFLSGFYTLTILEENRIVHQRVLIIHP
jgi:serine protease